MLLLGAEGILEKILATCCRAVEKLGDFYRVYVYL